eukprot:gnl/TRDRNA2_/TRDRNA2_176072_c0_seq1.p1 gnl/TRDRNA2_/TRDRNA2_176072_c0~~gnl/TRDRNA2_/TRDRNA2_176072_c0_seq1.p1  ORF type:complete len:692 (-),score=122.38 gnl/TRDRNA2_/TRDRNA2_176072_c0_seq1:34-2109(-)
MNGTPLVPTEPSGPPPLRRRPSTERDCREALSTSTAATEAGSDSRSQSTGSAGSGGGMTWQLAGLGDLAKKLGCINMDSALDASKLQPIGFNMLFDQDDKMLSAWQDMEWGAEIGAVLVLGKVNELMKVDEAEDMVSLTPLGQRFLKLIKSLQTDTSPPVIVVLSGIPWWSSDFENGDPLLSGAVELQDCLYKAGADDVVMLSADERLVPWRVVSASCRSIIFEERIDNLQKKTEKEVANAKREFLWQLPGDMLQNIPKMDKNIDEKEGVSPDISGRIGGGVDEYTFEVLLGKGSFGACYKASCKRFGGTVAVKEIAKSSIQSGRALASLDREFCIMRYLKSHQNIVTAHEVLHTQESFYVVMTFAGTMTLNAYCKKRQKEQGNLKGGNGCDKLALTQEEVERFFAQSAAAVAHLHRSQVCHRDIKPENIIVSDASTKPSVALTDFGLATVVCNEDQVLRDCVGSLPFAAPEVLRQVRRCAGYRGFPTDAWSLAVTFVDLAWGHRGIERAVGWKTRAPQDRMKQAEDLEQLEELWTKDEVAEFSNVSRVIAGLLKVSPLERWSVDKAESYLRSLCSLEPPTQRASATCKTWSPKSVTTNDTASLQSQIGWQHFQHVEVLERCADSRKYKTTEPEKFGVDSRADTVESVEAFTKFLPKLDNNTHVALPRTENPSRRGKKCLTFSRGPRKLSN